MSFSRRAALVVLLLLGTLGRSAETQAQNVRQSDWTIPGLQAPVEILVDEWGVPHIYAESQDDVFFVQGFNAGRDRLWQLDLWRRRGDGTLSEILGPDYVEKDRAARLFLFRGDMHAEWLAYASDTKRIVTSFVAGINAFIRLTEKAPALLSPEFELLDYRPSLWTPETVVRIRSHGLLRNVASEVSRARVLSRLGSRALELRDKLEPEHELRVPLGLDLSLIGADVLDVYRLGTRGVRFRPDAMAAVGPGSPRLALRGAFVAGALAGALDGTAEADLGGIGSNNWAVSPARSATGRAILADDPHRRQAVPSLRYIVHLSAPGLDVIGAGEPALPGVSIGHNGHIAFGLTIFSIDQEDLYVYETQPGNPLEYRYNDGWERMQTIEEAIPVRGRGAVVVELRYTRHGPVIYEDPARRLAFALRAAWLEPGMAPYLGSLEIMRARSWAEFLAAMNRWGAPSENQVFADVDGNIGWKPGGLAPIRPNWDGLLPVPGEGQYEWDGFLDMDALPVEYNPSRGWVATANQMNLPSGYDTQLGWEWRAPFRYGRIAEILEQNRALTLEDSVALQSDYLSLPARRLTALLEGAEAENEVQQKALDLLLSWDHRLERESSVAPLFEIWLRRKLDPLLLQRLIELNPSLPEDTDEVLSRIHPERLLEILESPDGWLGGSPQAERDRILLDSLESAVAATEERLGTDWSEWRWGNLHTIELRHPLSALMDPGVRAQADVGPLPRGGSGDTVGATGYDRDFLQVSGASFRMVIDVGEWDNSLAMNNPGQAGDLRSEHYDDLFERWANDQAFPLLYSRQRIEQHTSHRIRLTPP